jgi:transcriptional regulator with XRE-family HTH domain
LGRTTDIAVARKVRTAPGASKARAQPLPQQSAALLTTISVNLKRLRTRQGHSLERLARLAGVSRAMLSQIETGKSVPTISLLLKIANALGVPVANLLVPPASRATVVLPKGRSRVISASNGRFTSRALFPSDGNRRAEFYEIRLAAQHREVAEAQPSGTKENVIVVDGRVELSVGSEQPVVLPPGDAAFFHADVPRSYRNLEAKEAVLYVVMTYVEPIGQPSPYAFAGE